MTLLDMTVRTADGLVRGRRGRRLRRGTISWRGIPFAAPPVGGGRFADPQPVLAWPGVRDCTRFGDAAIQERRFAAIAPGRYQPMSEDCLTLNVFSPETASTAPRPVMVFIHGGAYILGTTATPLYDASLLARSQDVVVVTVQYRFGAFGMLDFSGYSTPERTFAENPGLADHLAALRWVQRNIDAFGGDPDNVTVFGESAGASSVLALLSTPAAAGLFHRAIAESPAPDLIVAKHEAAIYADEFVRILADPTRRASSVADRGEPIDPARARELLDGAEPAEIFRAGNRLMRFARHADLMAPVPFGPVAGGELLPALPLVAARHGGTHPVPLVIGTNRDEGKLFDKFFNMLPDAERALVRVEDAGARDEVIGEYEGGAADRLRLSADATFWAPTITFADAHSATAPTYVYRFDFSTRALDLAGVGATHATELFAVFGAYRLPLGVGLAVGDWRDAGRVTADVQSRWGGFARTGIPGDDWPRYVDADREILVIDRHDQVEADPDAGRRAAWQRAHATPPGGDTGREPVVTVPSDSADPQRETTTPGD
ncbi:MULTISPECIES: carboxylesterase/lipase family protein [unclassified Gordonia (in: high G+C Gram-positive bacteria)]